MGYTVDWQRFFQEWHRATYDHEGDRTNEVLSVIRSLVETIYMVDTSFYEIIDPEDRIGFAQINRSEIGT